MTSTRVQQSEHFDLLPFINILMCTLGCLLLVALSMASLSLGSAPEEWRPETGGGGKIPVLLIWDGETLLWKSGKRDICLGIQTNGSFVPPACPAGSMSRDLNELRTYFQAQRDTHYALIAIRPSGFANFSDVKKLFADQQVAIGYEPIAQNKQVRLSGSGP